MPITVRPSTDRTTIQITIMGSFDFSLHRDFRNAYRDITQAGVKFNVNLHGAEYMDSAALGMLLLLREHAENHKSNVTIQSPSPEIKRILLMAKFDQMLCIDG